MCQNEAGCLPLMVMLHHFGSPCTVNKETDGIGADSAITRMA